MNPETDTSKGSSPHTTDLAGWDDDAPAAAGIEQASDASTEPPDAERRLSRTAAWLAMGAVALALTLVALAPNVDHDDGPASAEDAAMVGRPAPLNYTLKDMDGVPVSLASFKGKVILINFWATWCPPCEVEIPDLVELQKEYAGDIVILGVSIDDTAEMLKPFASDRQMNYPVLLGLGQEDMQNAYGPMYGLPVSVFINRAGVIARRHTGILSKDQFEREIKALL
jgi:thiol-disulfide isomerase/thioredoxin